MSELRAPCPTRRTIWVATEMTATTKNQFARIDVHSHVIPAELLQAIEKRPERFQMQVDRKAGKLVRESAGALPLFEEFWDAKAKVDGMDGEGRVGDRALLGGDEHRRTIGRAAVAELAAVLIPAVSVSL